MNITFHSITSWYLGLALLLIANLSWGQISTREAPISTQIALEKTIIPLEVMPPIDRKQLQAADEKDKAEGIPPRFGEDFSVNLNLENAGIWRELPKGDRLWQLSILAEDALSINFLFDDFWLPEGAKLFIYNENQSQVIGAFTNRNNKEDRHFGTGLVYGDYVTLEYYEPVKVRGQGIININKVVHGYRHIQLPDEFQKAFSDSGTCNVNTVCQEGNNWRDEIKGVALILVGGVRNCTGSLIMTTAKDCEPYFLTANHCLGNNDAISNPTANNWSFMWLYESPDCGANVSDGPINMVTNGATIVANNGNPGSIEESDFALLRLNENPVDAQFDVYFNGFDARNNTFNGVTGIHHPRGDVKKISMENATSPSTNYGTGTVNTNGTHWHVIDWDSGTTEPGSSGSPLFDNANKRIIGDLSGGGAACGNNLSDWYGKMFYSWTGGGTNDNRRKLNTWLDPNNTGDMFVDGQAPCDIPPIVSFTNVSSSVNEETSCETKSINLPVTITKAAVGNTTVNFNISGSAQNNDYSLVSNTVTFPNGSTATQNLTININEDSRVEGTETIIITIASVTGSDAIAGSTQQMYTLTINDDDNNDTPVANISETILNVDFSDGSNNFTSFNANNGAANFALGQRANVTSDYWELDNTNTGVFAFVNDDDCNCDAADVRLQTPVLDFSSYDQIELSFAHAFANGMSGDGEESESANVMVSTDGVNFTAVSSITNTSTATEDNELTTPWVYNNTVNLNAFAGNSNVIIAFQYSDDNGWLFGMAIDDVVVTGTGETLVQTAVNSSNGFFEQPLGPQQTLNYYDENSGNIMLRIKNNSNNDYGCTRVEVDRAGNGAKTGWESDMTLTEKTFKVTPENNHADGDIEVELYYTEAEIAGWEAQTTGDRSVLEMYRADGSIATGMTNNAENQTVTTDAFGTAFIYTATFNNGLKAGSGFGLGNASAPLPLELLSFEAQAATAHIDLHWKTGSALNHTGFYLQRSTDAVQFTNLTWIKASTTTSEISEYYYADQAAKRGVTYFYRLLQLDKDASETYSSIRSAILSTDVQISFSPNPVHNIVNIEAAQQNNWSGTIELYDVSGKLWYSESIVVEKLLNQQIDLSQLPAGIYWLKINGITGVSYTDKLLKL